jgi:hypothetical protein
MKLSIRERSDRTIVALGRAEDGTGRSGDVTLEIAPDQVVGGIPYDVWRSHVGETVELEHLRRSAAAPVP